jgi:hypothetical protein
MRSLPASEEPHSWAYLDSASLVRGVSNHGAAPSFETGARKRVHPPQDEADNQQDLP